ncbi:CDAN1-interacting nuclease 1-like isoform X2 [Sycon ciliatum]|uniref:CDAN1-interacting nuclease 1-like isoform X2 n=1 Tax=Sycon ciliatum TaxID=27933 RepID=UPI0020AD347D|eukprot:scpid91404/ scgid1087/ Uncharacterized protein C15orf41 homolog
MKRQVYLEIVSAMRLTESRDSILQEIMLNYPSVSRDTLLSIYAHLYQKQTVQTLPRHRQSSAMETYYRRYLREKEDSPEGSVLTQMANEVCLAPTLLARIILERYCLHEMNNPSSRSLVSKWIAQPPLIPDKILAAEVQQCVLQDPNYGPLVDKIKHSVGLECELKLQEKLAAVGAAFCDEEELQAKQYPSTPDVKLEVPIAVNGFVINWIESKAMFGDEQTISGHLQDQLWNYRNLFGPGLVIYWFGFVEEANRHQKQGFLLADDFPESIVLMDTA